MKFALLAVVLIVCIADIHSLNYKYPQFKLNLRSLRASEELHSRIRRAVSNDDSSSEETSAEVAEYSQKAGFTDEEIQVMQRINRSYKNAKTVKAQSEIMDEICRAIGKGGQIVPVPANEPSASDVQKGWEEIKDKPLQERLEYWTDLTDDKSKSKPIKAVALKNTCVIIWNAYQEILAERKKP